MFRKLFISLLILSALASDGLFYFPANIYNFYMNSNNDADFTGEQALPKDYAYEPGNMEASISDAFLSSTFTLTCNSIEKLKCICDVVKADHANMHFSPCFNEIPFYASFFKDEKQNIFKKSDTSPPSII